MKKQAMLRYADPFFGNGEVGTPIPRGIAAAWNWRKAQNGNTHPGATRPFGMVSACPYSGAYPTGYGLYDRTTSGPARKLFDRKMASGITHFQLNGTGDIQFFYNYFRFVPTADEAAAGRLSSLDNEKASPGKYSCRLSDLGVSCDLTAGPKAIYHRYKFKCTQTGTLFVDLGSGGINIPGFPNYRRVPEYLEVTRLNMNSWHGKIRCGGVNIYFHLAAKTLIAASTVVVNGIQKPDLGELRCDGGDCDPNKITGFLLQQGNGEDVLDVVIGFSLSGVETARINAAEHLGGTFEQSVKDAEEDWADHLAAVPYYPKNERDAELFYSCLYHSLIKPADCGNESPWWDDKSPFFTDYVTLWDQYKTQLPLVMKFYPKRGERIARAMLRSIETHSFFPTGYLLENDFTRFAGQASALSIIVIGDAFSHKLLTIDDWPRIKAAVELEFATSYGRDLIENGKAAPYSHTLDLVCAAQAAADMAEACSDAQFAAKMRALTHNWRNVYDPETGLLSEESKYYEGTKWNYSFRPHPHMAERLELAGGKKRFAKLLDTFFGYDDIANGVVNPIPPSTSFERTVRKNRFEGLNNEPDMEAPFAYLWADRPDRTRDVIEHVMKYQFTSGENGLPGNNDSGALSSWYVWNAVDFCLPRTFPRG